MVELWGSSAFESTDELNRAWRNLQDIDQVTALVFCVSFAVTLNDLFF